MEIFGMEKPNNISCDEAFFFFDSFFKGLFKILVKKGDTDSKPTNRRFPQKQIFPLIIYQIGL